MLGSEEDSLKSHGSVGGSHSQATWIRDKGFQGGAPPPAVWMDSGARHPQEKEDHHSRPWHEAPGSWSMPVLMACHANP